MARRKKDETGRERSRKATPPSQGRRRAREAEPEPTERAASTASEAVPRSRRRTAQPAVSPTPAKPRSPGRRASDAVTGGGPRTTRTTRKLTRDETPATVKAAKAALASVRRGRQATEAPPPPVPAARPRRRAASAPRAGRSGAVRREREEDRIASTKYSSPEAARPLHEGDLELPQSYGRSRVRLLMQSPGRLFVHWDVSPVALEDLRREVGRRATLLARLALRITTPGAERPLIVLLPRGARSWYVDVPGKRHEYRAELGLMLASGEFRVLAVSNVARMPRTEPSPVAGTRRVAFSRSRPAGKHLLGEALPDDVSAEEAGEEGDVGRLVEGASPDAQAADALGGSSELSGGTRRRRPAGKGRASLATGELGGSSDLRPGGPSSDILDRRR